jgi:hypothetical protein
MNFSGWQWIAVVTAEVLVRMAGFIVLFFPIGFLFFPLSLLHSALHFFLMFLTSGVVALFNLNRRAYFWLVILLTNVSFAASMTSFRVASVKAQHATFCAGVLQQKCSWIDGRITAAGIQSIAEIVAIQVAVNLVPIWLMAAFFRRAERNSAFADPLSV